MIYFNDFFKILIFLIPMKNQSKRTQLECQRTMLLHTLDFLITHYTGYFVMDEYDSQKQYYNQEKSEVEKYFSLGKLPELKLMLKKFQKNLYLKRDEYYPVYLERMTGFPLKPYSQLSTNIRRIFAEKNISTEEDSLEVEFLLAICKNAASHMHDTAKLLGYLDKYRNSPLKKAVPRNVLQTEIEAGTILIDNPSSRQNSSRHTSPSGKNWIELHRSGKGMSELTYVVARVDGSNGTIYSVRGKAEEITIEWADNNTILIHTSQDYETVVSTSKLSTKHTIIHIKYVFI
jgi:hypothetical protein